MKEADALRIVSLLPGLTELVHALGRGENLEGRSHECDFPAVVKDLPVLTEPKYTYSPDHGSRQVHQSVSEILRQGLSVYRVFEEKLTECSPDVILTQDHCRVCAVSVQELNTAVKQLLSKHTKIVSVEPSNLEEVLQSFQTVADAINCTEKGLELVQSVRSRFDEIRQKTRHEPAPSVISIEWLDPLMTGGNWMPELVEIAGGKNLLSVAGEHSPWIEWEEIRQADPDVLLILPCGFTISKTLSELHLLEGQKGWKKMRAVKENRVFVLDGNHYFNRPGPRIKESAEILAEILHPNLFEPGYENKGWIKPY